MVYAAEFRGVAKSSTRPMSAAIQRSRTTQAEGGECVSLGSNPNHRPARRSASPNWPTRPGYAHRCARGRAGRVLAAIDGLRPLARRWSSGSSSRFVRKGTA